VELELDPVLNYVPDPVRHIHFMGVGGTGMGAMAGLMQQAGYQVSGSDQQVYPPMSDFLAASGIAVRQGYSADNLLPRPDLVVVGNVIGRANPEAVGLARARIPYLSFPQALARFFLTDRQSLVVAGTHGKTTTASLLATLLHEAGREPGFMIGGLVRAFGRNFNIGSGDCFVVEGDEYDTAFFDKGPKFLHYRPRLAIITSIEFDHADIYADLEAVKHSFRRLVAIMPRDGLLVACIDDPVVREIVAAAPCPVQGYGEVSDDLAWRLHAVEVGAQNTSFEVSLEGRPFGRFQSVMPGRHNALNALAVIAVLHRLGIDRETMATGLSRFAGVRRRQEVRGEVEGITVIDDFAHHPTAVRETLAALADAYKGRRLLAVFEPRTNSSRRSVFQEAYVGVFDRAASIVVREPAALDKVPLAERFSARRLVADLAARGLDSHHFTTTEEILDHLGRFARPGDVIAILSNGGFDNIHERLLERLAAR